MFIYFFILIIKSIVTCQVSYKQPFAQTLQTQTNNDLIPLLSGCQKEIKEKKKYIYRELIDWSIF